MTTLNSSPSLVWELVRDNNSYLVKSKRNGGVRLTRDPMSLTNKHCFKDAGFIHRKAIGVASAENGGLVIHSKKASAASQPAKSIIKTVISGKKTNRKAYRTIAVLAAGKGYRLDIRAAAVQRVSAIRKSQRPVRAEPEPKLRGTKAKKTAEESS